MSGDNGSNLAVSIDADNVSSKVVAGLMAEVANYGTASVRRIYGDWTSPHMKSCRELLLAHSLTPIQQFAYTTGKNATDGAMIIDAMDLLYIGRFSAFCLVSKDSDFTRLAARIREQGITVYGFGERKTSNAFVVACNKFVYFDALLTTMEETGEVAGAAIPASHTFGVGNSQPPSVAHVSMAPRGPKASSAQTTLASRPLPTPRIESRLRTFDQGALTALRSAISKCAVYEDDYVNLSEAGIMLPRISPDLNPHNYGFDHLRDFVVASGIVDLYMKPMGPHPPNALVRLRE